jgi:hypothetical protein
MMDICIINFSKKPAHKKHIKALYKFLTKTKIKTTSFLKAKNIYFQTTHPKNIIYMVMAKFLKKNIIFYYHEPCFFKEKLKKRNTLLYSTVVKIVQHLEYFFSDYVIVSNSFIKRKVLRIHKLKKNIVVIPLIIEDEPIDNKERDIDILFLGRAIPDQRHLNEFLDLSRKLKNLNFAILTADNLTKLGIELNSVKVISEGKIFSEELRINTLNRTKVVWTPYISNYNQSGIIPDALAHGCGLILSRYETDKELIKKPFVLLLSNKKKNWDIEVENFLKNYKEEYSNLAYLEFRKKYSIDSYTPLVKILK